MPGASVSAVVDRKARGLEEAFIAAARTMIERDGVDAITTTCGFLAIHQDTMAASLERAGGDLFPAAGAKRGAPAAGWTPALGS